MHHLLMPMSALLPILLMLFLVLLPRVKGKREPPGPRRIPFLGNVLSPKGVHLQLTKYAKEFGPIYSLRMVHMKIVVLSSMNVVRDLLETKSAIYTSRLPMKMASMSGMGAGVIFQDDLMKLREGRKLLITSLSPRELEAYRHVVYRHSVMLLADLLHSPDDFLLHLRRPPMGLMLELAYGYRLTSDDDHILRRSQEWARNFASVTTMGEYIVDLFPFLAHLPTFIPGMSFKKTATAWNAHSESLAQDTFRMVKDAVARGVAAPCVVSQALTNSSHKYDENIIAHTAAEMITGGAQTTVCALSTFFLAMVLYPEAQHKAQAEIDRVIGNRLPSYSDRDDLPYVMSVLRETMRWYPVFTLTPRNPIKDDIYEGNFIAQDTLVFANLWGMFRDETAYPEAHIFRPERWHGIDNIEKHVDPLELAFGFGRRVCPGKHAAREMLFTIIVSVLKVFDISKAMDANGQEITPEERFTEGGLMCPEPFECCIKPRSRHTQQLVEQAISALP